MIFKHSKIHFWFSFISLNMRANAVILDYADETRKKDCSARVSGLGEFGQFKVFFFYFTHRPCYSSATKKVVWQGWIYYCLWIVYEFAYFIVDIKSPLIRTCYREFPIVL